MRQLVEPEGRSRVTKASLLPWSVAVAALTQFGREDSTAAILKAMRKLPRRWELEIQEVLELAHSPIQPANPAAPERAHARARLR